MTKPKLSLLRAAARRALLLSLVAAAAFAAGGDDKAATTRVQSINNQQPASINNINNNDRLRFHARDIFDIRALLADSASGEGDAFDNFYRNSQIRLFNLLEDDITRRAQDTLSSNFSAVRSAEVFLQTSIGGRQGQYGAQVIGKIAEHQDRALGWQLRAYDSEDSSGGANIGMFYRQIEDDASIGGGILHDGKFIFGGNVFFDYEDSDYGGFFRYGVGGEVQSRILQAAANFYIPLTDAKHQGALANSENIIAFSRRGFDANLRAHLPNLTDFRYFNLVDAEATYYRFGGDAGAEADSGFRWGAGFVPHADFRMKLYYDSTDNEFGGALSYTRTIGEQTSINTRANNTNFIPDLFAPVWREHSQRIALATLAPSVPQFAINTRGNPDAAAVFARVNATTEIGEITIPRGYFDNDNYTISVAAQFENNNLWLSGMTTSPITLFYQPQTPGRANIITIMISGNIGASAAATSFVATASSFAAFGASFDAAPARFFITGIADNFVANITPTGGVPPYSYSSSNGDISILPSGRVLFNSTGAARIVNARILISDQLPQTTTLSLTVESVGAVSTTPDVLVGVESTVAVVVLPGAMVVDADSLPSGFDVIGGTAVLFTIDAVSTFIQSITVASDNLTLTLGLRINARIPPPVTMPRLQSGSYGSAVLVAGAGTSTEGTLALITPSGGYLRPGNDYTYVLSQDTSSSDLVFTLRPANSRYLAYNATRAITGTATVEINDDSPHTAPLSLFFTLTAATSITANFGGIIPVNQSGNAGMINASGGDGTYNFRLLSQSRPNALTVGGNGNITYSAQNITGNITARIEVDDNADITPPFTLAITMMVVGALAPNPNPLLVGVQGTVATVILPNAVIQAPGALPDGFSALPGARVLLFSAAMAGVITQSITISPSGGGAPITLPLIIRAEDPPPIVVGIADGHQGSVLLATGHRFAIDNYILVASITAGGGYLNPGSDYNYFVTDRGGGDLNVGANHDFVAINTRNPATVTVVVRVRDDNQHTDDLFASISITVVPPLRAGYDGQTEGLYTVPLNTPFTALITASGGNPPYLYQLRQQIVSPLPAGVRIGGGGVTLRPQSTETTITTTLIVNDHRADTTPPVTLPITFQAINTFGRSQTNFTLGVPATLGMLIGGANLVGTPEGIEVSNNQVLFSAAVAGNRDVDITVSANGTNIEFTVPINVVAPPPIVIGIADGHQGTVVVATDTDSYNLIASITAGGGYLNDGSDYTYAVEDLGGGDLIVGTDSNFVGINFRNPNTVRVILSARDDNEHTAHGRITISITVVNPLRAGYDGQTEGLYTVPLNTPITLVVTASGGNPPYSYDLRAQAPLRLVLIGATVLITLQPQTAETTITASVIVNDAAEATPPVTLPITIQAINVFSPIPVPRNFTLGVPATLGVLGPAANIVGTPEGITVSNNAVLFSASVEGSRNLQLTVNNNGTNMEFALPINAIAPPPMVIGLRDGYHQGTVLLATGIPNVFRTFALITAGGGYLNPGNSFYDLRLVNNDASFNGFITFAQNGLGDGVLRANPQNPRTLTITLQARDDNEHTEHVTIELSLTIINPMRAGYDGQTEGLFSGPINTDITAAITVSGGEGEYRFGFVGSPTGIPGANFRFVSSGPRGMVILNASAEATLTVSVSIDDESPATPAATLTITIEAMTLNAFMVSPGNPQTHTIGVPRGILGRLAQGAQLVGNPPGILVLGGGANTAVILSASVAGMQMVSLTVSAEGANAEYIIPVNVVLPPPIVGNIIAGRDRWTFLTDRGGSNAFFASITASGGYLNTGGSYDITLLNNVPGFRFDLPTPTSPRNRLIYLIPNTAVTATATVLIHDDNEHTQPGTLFFFPTTHEALSIAFFVHGGDTQRGAILSDGTRRRVGSINPRGGQGPYTWQVLQADTRYFERTGTQLTIATPRLPRITPPIARTAAVTLILNDQLSATPPFTMAITVGLYAPLSMTLDITPTFPAGQVNRRIGTWRALGGVPGTGGNHNTTNDRHYDYLINGERIFSTEGNPQTRWTIDSVYVGAESPRVQLNVTRLNNTSTSGSPNPIVLTLSIRDRGTHNFITPHISQTITLTAQ